MSDTPIDHDLEHKSSTRKPEFLADRIEEFRQEYNTAIKNTPLDDRHNETFLLTSKSQTRRRLLDMGLAYFVEHGVPYGFAFDPEDATSPLHCNHCDETDPGMFRLGASVTDSDDGTEIVFDTLYCMTCEHEQPLEDEREAHGFSFDGE